MDTAVFFVEFNGNATCLICKEKVAVLKEYNLKRHYSTKHGDQYEKYQEDERKKQATQLQRELTSQQSLFHRAKKDADAAVEASYVVSEMIAKAGKPFTEGQFMKDCMLKVADILCPEKKNMFNNLSLSQIQWQSGLPSYRVTFMISYAGNLEFSLHTLWPLTKVQTKLTLLS